MKHICLVLIFLVLAIFSSITTTANTNEKEKQGEFTISGWVTGFNIPLGLYGADINVKIELDSAGNFRY